MGQRQIPGGGGLTGHREIDGLLEAFTGETQGLRGTALPLPRRWEIILGLDGGGASGKDREDRKEEEGQEEDQGRWGSRRGEGSNHGIREMKGGTGGHGSTG